MQTARKKKLVGTDDRHLKEARKGPVSSITAVVTNLGAKKMAAQAYGSNGTQPEKHVLWTSKKLGRGYPDSWLSGEKIN